MEKNFWIAQFIILGVFFIVNYLNGLLVKHKSIKVNYTRKINHFFLFFFPIYLNSILLFQKTLESTILSLFILGASLLFFIKPIRDKFSFIKTAFLSFDRPEDRPHTLIWLISQIWTTTLIIIPILIYFSHIGKPQLIFIPILINAIGDGLAEPIGIKFGKHPYKTHALFTSKKFIRTLEGSLCVFIISIISLLMFKNSFTPAQFTVALLSLPLLMTLAEAFSPHTWDLPILYFVSGLSLSIITLI